MEILFNISLSITETKIPKSHVYTENTACTRLERIFLHSSITMRPSSFCIMTENNSWRTLLEQMPAVSHLFYHSNSNSSVALYWFRFFYFKSKPSELDLASVSRSFQEQTKGRLTLLDPKLVLVGNLHKYSLCFCFISTWTEWIHT